MNESGDGKNNTYEYLFGIEKTVCYISMKHNRHN
jgi:hypothetical protein